MNQKAVRYGLIAGVAVVWGLIIYRVVDGLTGDDDLKPGILAVSKNAVPEEKEERFTLIADYPDPFLAGGDSSATSVTAPAVAMQTVAPPPVRTTPPPDPNAYKEGMIQYLGMISNPEKKLKIASVNIKGTELLVREQEQVMGFTIKKIEAGGIVVVYRGKKLVINRIQ